MSKTDGYGVSRILSYNGHITTDCIPCIQYDFPMIYYEWDPDCHYHPTTYTIGPFHNDRIIYTCDYYPFLYKNLLIDGHAVHHGVPPNDFYMYYDGTDELVVISAGDTKQLSLRACKSDRIGGYESLKFVPLFSLLCNECPIDIPYYETSVTDIYRVTISGFPSICTAGVFNGWWYLHNVDNCTWRCTIDTFHQLTLQNISGSWNLYWSILPSVANGIFLGSGGETCKPETMSWNYSSCFNPTEVGACYGMCAAIQSSAAITIGRV